MVLCLETWESRSSPGLQSTEPLQARSQKLEARTASLLVSSLWFLPSARSSRAAAGWSSPVARQAHNLKAAGSNPAPATKLSNKNKALGFHLAPFSFPNRLTHI